MGHTAGERAAGRVGRPPPAAAGSRRPRVLTPHSGGVPTTKVPPSTPWSQTQRARDGRKRNAGGCAQSASAKQISPRLARRHGAYWHAGGTRPRRCPHGRLGGGGTRLPSPATLREQSGGGSRGGSAAAAPQPGSAAAPRHSKGALRGEAASTGRSMSSEGGGGGRRRGLASPSRLQTCLPSHLHDAAPQPEANNS